MPRDDQRGAMPRDDQRGVMPRDDQRGAMPRDDQRGAVYAAEQQVRGLIDSRDTFPVVDLFGSSVVVPVDRKFADLPSMQRYADQVLSLRWVRAAWPDRAGRPVRLRTRAGAAKAHYEFETATIAVPPHSVGGRWAMRETVLLHELAHHLGARDGAPHGRAFTGRLVRLATELVGDELGTLLRVLMLQHGASVDVATV